MSKTVSSVSLTASAKTPAFDSHKFFWDMISGGGAAVISDTLIAPIERIKLLLQLQDTARYIPKGGKYKGLIDALERIPREEGFFAFWRGNWSNCLRIFPTQAFNFAFKDVYTKAFVRHSPDQHFLYTLENLLAGGISGSTTLVIVFPLDLARTRLALDVGSKETRKFTGMFDCLSKVVRDEGVRGIYKGFGISVFGIFVYRALFFGIYDSAKGIWKTENGKNTFIQRWMMAQLSATIAGLVAYPIDSVRRRMMLQSGLESSGSINRYKSSWDCFKSIFKEHGLRGFYRGVLTNIVRGLSGSLILVLYDEIRSVLPN